MLADDGVATIEVPHLVRLIEEVQFDTIYHEHYSYFSLTTLVRLCERHGLEIFHVEELPSHGGSLRIYVTHASDETHARDASVRRASRARAERRLHGARDVPDVRATACTRSSGACSSC